MDKYQQTIAWIHRILITLLFVFIIGCNHDDQSVADSGKQIIMEVIDAQLAIVESQVENQTRILKITASGNVSSAGWTNPALVPVQTIVPPKDGIYEFSFYATPPKRPADSVITPIEVTHRVKPLPEDLTGVRILSETNEIDVMLAEQKPTPAPEIIHEITGAQLTTVEGTTQIEISAQGTVTNAGWSNPILIAHEYIVPPQDGIYDVTLYATPPSQPGATLITPIEVTHRLNTIADDLTGVRIHSSTNNVVAMLEVKTPPPQPAIIHEISNVNLLLKHSIVPQLVINVTGSVEAEGWTQDKLVPHEYVVPPADGIYEFTYYATPPAEPGPVIITPAKVTHILEPLPDDLTGVRIYSATNSIEALLETQQPGPSPENIEEITGIQLSVMESQPRQLNIQATGIVTSGGWTGAVLVPVQYIVPPEDGVYDFTFYATPPEGAGTAAITPIEVSYRLSPLPEDLKGIRIHSETNSLVALLETQLPQPVPEIIYSITDIQITSVAKLPDQIDILVKGKANSGGWTQPKLIAYQYMIPPQDGIYDFTFYATPPDGPATGALAPIEITHRLKTVPTDMKGIRIHATTNAMEALLFTETLHILDAGL